MDFTPSFLTDTLKSIWNAFKKWRINNKNAIIHFKYIGEGIPEIRIIDVAMLAINDTKNRKVFTDFKLRFYNGSEWINLDFDRLKLPPHFTIEPQSPLEISFRFELPHGVDMLIWAFDKSHIEMRYKVNGKDHSTFMDEIKVVEIKETYTWL